MYSVLLVDDEEEVLSVIQKKLNWEELGFTVAGTCANGVEALEFVEANQPDVILSDIRMPYMDGLELAKNVHEFYPDINMIIFSGFDDFEFAKSAISLGVRDYLLKPIDTAELFDIFKKTKERLDEERTRQNSYERLSQYYHDSLPILRESFLIALVEGSMDEKRLTEAQSDYGLSFDSPYHAVSVVHLSFKEGQSDRDRQMKSLSIRQVIEEREDFKDRHIIFSYRDDIISIVQFDSPDELSDYTDICDRFTTMIERTRGIVLTIGIGRPVENISDIRYSYEDAREALSLRVIYGRGTAINISDIAPVSRFDDSWQIDAFDRILRQIKVGSPEELKSAVDAYIKSLIDSRPDANQFRLLMMELLTGLFRFLGHNEIEPDEVGISEEDQYGILLRIDSADELADWLYGITESIRDIMTSHRKTASRSFVAKAKDYVTDHYSDCDLTINDVCQELSVSAAYFSTLFKKETGQTFINYLTDYRMQEAVRMMIEQDEKTYVIAEKVGYADANYFSYVFKKQFGVSPTKYKKQQTAG